MTSNLFLSNHYLASPLLIGKTTIDSPVVTSRPPVVSGPVINKLITSTDSAIDTTPTPVNSVPVVGSPVQNVLIGAQVATVTDPSQADIIDTGVGSQTSPAYSYNDVVTQPVKNLENTKVSGWVWVIALGIAVLLFTE